MAATAALPLGIIASINFMCLSERPFALATESLHDYRQRAQGIQTRPLKTCSGFCRPIQLLFQSRSFPRSRLRRDFEHSGCIDSGSRAAAEKVGRRFLIERT
jgi:hypothetical protein